jgi:hypothetical protein
LNNGKPCVQLQLFADNWCLPLQDLRIDGSRNAGKYLKMGGEKLGAVREKGQIDFDENRQKRQSQDFNTSLKST